MQKYLKLSLIFQIKVYVKNTSKYETVSRLSRNFSKAFKSSKSTKKFEKLWIKLFTVAKRF